MVEHSTSYAFFSGLPSKRKAFHNEFCILIIRRLYYSREERGRIRKFWSERKWIDEIQRKKSKRDSNEANCSVQFYSKENAWTSLEDLNVSKNSLNGQSANIILLRFKVSVTMKISVTIIKYN